MGLFTILAGAASARDQGRRDASDRAKIEEDRQRRIDHEEEDRKTEREQQRMAMAMAIANMSKNDVVANDQRDTITPEASNGSDIRVRPHHVSTTAPVAPGVPNLTGGVARADGNLTLGQDVGGMAPIKSPTLDRMTVPDMTADSVTGERRYTELGDTGFSHDNRPAPSFMERRKLAQQDTLARQRSAYAKLKHPELKNIPDGELRGLVLDEKWWDEMLKAPPSETWQTIQTPTGYRQVNPKTGQTRAVTDDVGGPVLPSKDWPTVQTPSGYSQVDPASGQSRPVTAGPDGKQLPAYHAPPNPGSARPRQPTEPQLRIGMVYPNAVSALDKIREFVGKDGTVNLPTTLLGKMTFGGYGLTPEQQGFQQAGEVLLSSILRPETGAAVTKDEWQKYSKQYIPMAGDSPSTVRQKLDAAQMKLESMRRIAGSAVPDDQPRPRGADTKPPANPWRQP